jgi:nitrite reductase (NO-forming)
MFAAVYLDADPNHALTGVSTYPIAPGQGVIFDAVMSEPGKYPIVDHSMRAMAIGAAGALEVKKESESGLTLNTRSSSKR